MKAKQIIREEDWEACRLDAVKCFAKSLDTLKTDGDKKDCREFWGRFLPVGQSIVDGHGSEGPKLYRRLFRQAVDNAFQILWYSFYWSGVSKLPKKKTYPHPTPYQVMIPYGQSKDRETIICGIIPSEMKPGDTGVILYWELPAHLTRMPSINKALDPVREVTTRGRTVSILEMTKMLDNLNAAKERVNKEWLLKDITYNSITLKDEPCLRLPCYSVPLQVVYDMCAEEMGTFGWIPQGTTIDQLLTILREDGKEKWDLTRKNMTDDDRIMAVAILQWPIWQLLQLTDVDQLDYLQKLLSAKHKFPVKRGDGSKEVEYREQAARNLRDRCLRRIRAHLKE